MARSKGPPYCYPFPRPAVTVDVVIFTLRQGQLEVLLIQRAREPFQGKWAIPGGFVDLAEPLEVAARRELEEETGITSSRLEQLATFGEPTRDPRGRTISVAYMALVNSEALEPRGADDASAAEWFPVARLPPLAFDHAQIMRCALERLRWRMETGGIASGILPAEFTLAQMRRVYEPVLDSAMDYRKLVRRLVELKILGQKRMNRPRRPRRFRFLVDR